MNPWEIVRSSVSISKDGGIDGGETPELRIPHISVIQRIKGDRSIWTNSIIFHLEGGEIIGLNGNKRSLDRLLPVGCSINFNGGRTISNKNENFTPFQNHLLPEVFIVISTQVPVGDSTRSSLVVPHVGHSPFYSNPLRPSHIYKQTNRKLKNKR